MQHRKRLVQNDQSLRLPGDGWSGFGHEESRQGIIIYISPEQKKFFFRNHCGAHQCRDWATGFVEGTGCYGLSPRTVKSMTSYTCPFAPTSASLCVPGRGGHL